MIIKRGDTHTIQWAVNMDLTGATARLIVKSSRTEPVVLPCTIIPPSTIEHTLTGTLPEGGYGVEVEATIDGQIVTFPNNGYATLTVIADLD